jgi:iron complex outermembrane recepter protein
MTTYVAGAQAQQTAQPTGLEEIVVTATRRAESLAKVPISIAAFTPESLEDQNVKTLNDLARSIPSLSFNGSTVSIRGIGSSAGAATTGVYVDDTPIQILGFGYGLQNPVPLLFDLDRVEVLRGPQGTLFGGGAEGGVVRYITPQPDLDGYSGYMRAEAGDIENGGQNSELGFAFGGPIVDGKLGFRMSADQRTNGGWVDYMDPWTHQLTRKDGNSGMQRMFRFALTWAPADDLKITPSYHWQEDSGTSQYTSGGQGNVGNQSLYYSDREAGKYRALTWGNSISTNRWFLPALKVEYDTPVVNLISSTSAIYSHYMQDQDPFYMVTSYIPVARYLPGVNIVRTEGFFLPPGAAPFQPNYGNLNKSRVFTQEFRAQSNGDSRFQYVVGGYYTHNNNFNHEIDESPGYDDFLMKAIGRNVQQQFGVPLFCDGPRCDIEFEQRFNARASDLAAFGEFSYNVTDALKLTVGLRQTFSKFKFDVIARGPSQGGTEQGAGESSSKAFTPKLNVSYQLNDENMVYATAAKGYRAGGGNQPVPATTCGGDLANLGISAPPPTYGSDSVWSYEVGGKNRLFDGILSLDSAAYYLKWSDIQTRIGLPCAYALVLNTGEVTVKGAETAINARVNDNFSGNFSLGYMHGEYTKGTATPPGARPVASIGDRLPDPDLKVAAGVQFDTEYGDYPVFARVDWQFSHFADAYTIPTNPANASYDVNIPRPANRSFFTARTGFTVDSLDISLFVDNLLNSRKELTRSHTRNRAYYQFTAFRPRTVTLQARYKF